MTVKYLDPPQEYFSTDEMLEKYSTPKSAAVRSMQEMADAAWSFLSLDNLRFRPIVLDVGCGCGAGTSLFNEKGAVVVGVDITPEMLLRFKRVCPGPYNTIVSCDAGMGVPFRPGVFDAAYGIDVLNWIIRPIPGGLPVSKRLKKFLESIHGCLSLGGKAVFNFNPENSDQAELISTTATLCGFGGNVYINNPNSGASRVNWLVLEVGGNAVTIDQDGEKRQVGCPTVGTFKAGNDSHKKGFNKKEWIMKKKERQRMLGKKVANDSKYTGRSRRRWI